MKTTKAQQEMIGFVLIIVIVVIGIMIFLAISLRNDGQTKIESIQAKHMLDATMGYTTDCALVFEPQYETIEELFKSAYNARTCTNKNIKAKDYLNQSLKTILDTLQEGEATINGYRLDFLEKDQEGETGQLQVTGGTCTNSTTTTAAQRNLVSGNNRLIIRLTLCKGN